MWSGARGFSGLVLLLASLTSSAPVSGAEEGGLGGGLRRFWSGLPGVARIGLILIEGPIYDSRSVIAQVDKLGRNPMVKALVLRIDSPGGEVGAVQEILESLERYREEGRPVVASFGGVAASGGYYLACAADRIVSNPGALTGSIGVVMEFPEAEDLLKKLGIKFVVVKSGRFKDTGGFARGLSEEERRLLQETINDVYEQFLEAVWRARAPQLTQALARIRRVEPDGLSEGQVKAYLRGIADGRVMSGRQAWRAGLIDELGGLERAVETAASLAGLRGRPGVVTQRRRRPTTWRDLLGVVTGLAGARDIRRSGEGVSLEYMLR